MKVKTGAPPLKTNPTAMTSNPPHDHIATTMAERAKDDRACEAEHEH
jgi:hypothetical protein